MDSSVADYIKYLGFLLFLTHSVNFPCGRKRETGQLGEIPRLSAECWVDELFPRVIRFLIQGSNPWPQWWEDVALRLNHQIPDAADDDSLKLD